MSGLVIRIVTLLACLMFAGASDAQTTSVSQPLPYPTRPVRVIVPYAAGGATDVVARLIAARLSDDLSQRFYVEDRAGGSSETGTSFAAHEAADGYTILFVTNDLAVRPALAHVAYDPIASFAPVALVATSPEVVVVHPSVPAKSMAELMALLKANPGKYSFASPGAGTSTHLGAVQLFMLSYGLDLTPVPFAGAGPAIASTYAGQTPIAFTALASAAPFIKNGSLRALAVTSAVRSAAFPDVPTLAQAGFPGHESDVLIGIVLPAGTASDIVDVLHKQVARVVATPDVRSRLAELGFEPVASTPAEFTTRIKAEIARWAQVAHATNLTPQ
jgi:tripartite-type tricarboxylate transporter receptor subunit TctC